MEQPKEQIEEPMDDLLDVQEEDEILEEPLDSHEDSPPELPQSLTHAPLTSGPTQPLPQDNPNPCLEQEKNEPIESTPEMLQDIPADEKVKTVEVEKKPETPVDRKTLANMFKYLSDLSQSLPENEKRDMLNHEVPLKMEVVRSKLEGERSLLNTAQHFDRRNRNRDVEVELDDNNISNSLNFLKTLSSQYPEEMVSQNFDSKMAKVLNKIEKLRKLKK
ncbi:MAG: hypothetical protein PF447_12085 [Spirochaetaceae bacterium]|nr:hypothetical protein [Spirochaetaceae bacterium]